MKLFESDGCKDKRSNGCISQRSKGGVPWSMLFADNVVLVGTSKLAVEKLKRWRRALEGRGLEISRTKSEYLPFDCQDHIESIKLGEEEVKCVRSFKNLGSHISSNGEMGVELNHRIQSAWANLRTSGVLCGKIVNLKPRGRVYESYARPAMMYGAEIWPIKKGEERKLEEAEM
ncbi:uncharacterized protein LOC134772452 [Penaeus indicus]|uniref:uncharacterized protein LOC134772452 n=1 Tax=Penaeus indicus TaxID=29960 RepID=UPI00300C74EC